MQNDFPSIVINCTNALAISVNGVAKGPYYSGWALSWNFRKTDEIFFGRGV